MADVAVAPATRDLTTDHLVAGPDRRFYAWVLDRLLDMARTAVNVLADAVCTVIVARLAGDKGALTAGASPAEVHVQEEP